jgi:hypothetical protein
MWLAPTTHLVKEEIKDTVSYEFIRVHVRIGVVTAEIEHELGFGRI